MALDPRIALQGASFQAPDILGAMRQGQEYRQNQMAQQAAQATAARNAMVRERAATVDYNDPTSVNMFVREVGPDATPYLQAAGAGDTLFNTRAAETRSQGEFDIKRNEAGMTELRTVVGRVIANPDDATLADAAQRYPQFAADINRIAANPDVAARRTGLATLVASLPGGSEFLDAITQEYTNVDLGGTTQRVPNRTYLPGEVQSFTKTPDPTKYTDVPTVDGLVRVYADGRSELLRGPSGAPLTPAPSPEQQRADAEAAAERAAADLAARNAAKTNQTTVQNTRRVVGEILPNVSGWTAGVGSLIAAIPGTPAADLAANLDTLEANLSFERLAEMRANSPTGGALGQITVRELDLLGATIANIRNSQSPEQLRRNLQVIDGALARLEAAYAEAGLPSPTDDVAADPLEGRTAVGPNGQRLVRRNGEWVSQ